MKEEKEKKKSKIFLKNGTILTISIIEYDEEKIVGTDKFGELAIIPISEIKSMIPLK